MTNSSQQSGADRTRINNNNCWDLFGQPPTVRGYRQGMSHDMATTNCTTGKRGDLHGFTGNALAKTVGLS